MTMTTTIQIRRILCPVDFSADSETALESAGALAAQFGARVFVLYVEPLMPSLMGEMPAPRETVADRQRLVDELGRFAEPLRKSGVRYEVLLEEGSPVGEILARAGELAADLIVMGRRGQGGFERFLLGSVTEKVLRKAGCPVLCVSQGAGLTTAWQPSASQADPVRVVTPA